MLLSQKYQRSFGFYLLLAGILLLVLPNVWSQSVVSLQVVDNKTNQGITSVSVSLTQNRDFVVGKTNEEGKINFTINWKGKVNLSCSHPDYQSFDRTFDLNKDTVFFEIRLRPENVQVFQPVTIKAPGAVDTVFSSSRLHVEDFEVLENGNLVLLTYSKRLAKGSEILLFDGNEILNSFPVSGQAIKLEKDYRGNTQVICSDRVFTILPQDNNLRIAQLDKDYYYRYIAPILDTNGKQLYYSDFSENYPEFSYWKYNQEDSTYDKFRTIRDNLMMELYRSEYKWVDARTKLWAKSLEKETGIDAEIWVGANYFTQSVYYKELYAPFFKVGDQLYVFDYYNEQMYLHDTTGLMLNSKPIKHHLQKKETGWKGELIQDKATGAIYAWYEKNGVSFLGKVNLETGEITEKYQLNFKYLDKIEVHDNFVYYVYRPFESPQKKYLYKERLPKDFSGGGQNTISNETGK